MRDLVAPPHLSILSMCEVSYDNGDCRPFKINDMRVCDVDQYVWLGFFLEVCGDMGHGLDSGRTRREASVPRTAVMPAHDLLLVSDGGRRRFDTGSFRYLSVIHI